jgi:predicted acetyltransferase
MDGADFTASGSRIDGSLRVRAARESDLDRILEIHVAAFPDPRPIEVRRRLFVQNRLGDFAHLRVVERADEVLAHAFSFPLAVWFGGREVPGSAIASVGVAPEARGQGIAKALFASIHAETEARGGTFSLLYPFRQAFYARLGYAPVARYRIHDVSPYAIPPAWKDAAPGTLRRAQGHDRDGLARVYRDAARRGTGSLERPERAWDYDLLDERRHCVVLEQAGTVRGYVSFRLQQSEPHGRVRADVHELVADEDSGRRRLFAALGALGDQVGEVSVAFADDDPFDWAFVDADRDRPGTEEVEHALGVVCTGPMIRLLDPQGALVARGYATDGAVNLAIDAGPPFGLEVRGGVAHIVPPVAETTLHASVASIASVAFGGLRLEDARRVGWVRATGAVTTDALTAAARLIGLPSFFSVDGF